MKLAVYQGDAGIAGFEARLEALDKALHGKNVDLVVCPELFATGYFIEGDHRQLAQPMEGSYARALERVARTHDTAIVCGYPEAEDGRVFNAALMIEGNGHITANHRKRLPAPGSFEEQAFDPGNDEGLCTWRGLKLAIVICYEIEFPETARAAARKGADLLVVPTALGAQWAVVAEKVIPARAFENGVWLAYANHAGRENGQSYFGGSRIVAPDGEEIAVAGKGPKLLVAEIDAERVRAARERLPYLRDCPAISGKAAQ